MMKTPCAARGVGGRAGQGSAGRHARAAEDRERRRGGGGGDTHRALRASARPAGTMGSRSGQVGEGSTHLDHGGGRAECRLHNDMKDAARASQSLDSGGVKMNGALDPSSAPAPLERRR